ADMILETGQAAIRDRGRFSLVLSGGSTPRRVYARLAEADFPWDKTHLFWGDERAVPPDSTESNYRMVVESLLGKISIPSSHVHRIRGESEPRQAAEEYEEELRVFFENGRPVFDLILLGMGADGHTASLFPGTTALEERRVSVTSTWVEKLKTFRIS